MGLTRRPPARRLVRLCRVVCRYFSARGNGTFEGVVVIGLLLKPMLIQISLCGAGQLVVTQTQRPPIFRARRAHGPPDSYLAEVKCGPTGAIAGTLTDEHNLTQAAPRCNAATSASYFAMRPGTTCSSANATSPGLEHRRPGPCAVDARRATRTAPATRRDALGRQQARRGLVARQLAPRRAGLPVEDGADDGDGLVGRELAHALLRLLLGARRRAPVDFGGSPARRADAPDAAGARRARRGGRPRRRDVDGDRVPATRRSSMAITKNPPELRGS